MTEGLLLADVEDTIAKMSTLRSYGWASRWMISAPAIPRWPT